MSRKMKEFRAILKKFALILENFHTVWIAICFIFGWIGKDQPER